MNKTNDMKPFNLEEAKAGKPVCTREGCSARIICFDRVDDKQPIVALIKMDDGTETVIYYDKNGMAYGTLNEKHSLNLMMKSEKKQGWVNLYRESYGGLYTSDVYFTQETALKSKSDNEKYIDTILLEWEE